MPANVSEAMVRALYARTTPDLALLVTVDADGLDAPLRISSWPHAIEGTNRLGIVSRGEEFLYVGFDFAWAGASASEAARDAKITIDNADGRIAQGVRTAVLRPTVDIETVRVVAPDVVELALKGAGLVEAEIDATHATGTLRPRDFTTEPACAARYTIPKTPALY